MFGKHLTPSILLSSVIILLIVSLSLLSPTSEALFEFNRHEILHGDYWRLLSCNFVHFGTIHTCMNLAAFILIAISLLRNISLTTYSTLLLTTSLSVGFGVWLWNPELIFYRGFSGVLHGLIVAGLLIGDLRKSKLRYWLVALLFAKIIHEHQAGFQENQLQALLPVMVAVDAHLYGAVAGLFYAFIILLIEKYRKKN